MLALELTWGSVKGKAFAMLSKACACLDTRPKASESSDASLNTCIGSSLDQQVFSLPCIPDRTGQT